MKNLLAVGICMGFILNIAHAENGLSDDDRTIFYHTPEGSELAPIELIRPLERKQGGMFMDHLERFGLIPQPKGKNNDEGLPIGITVATTRDARILGSPEMIGINCAACHVSELRYDGQSVIIDGAPSRFDIRALYSDLIDAIESTLEDNGKLSRYIFRLVEHGVVSGIDSNGMALFEKLKGGQSNHLGSSEKQLLNDLLALSVKETFKAQPSIDATDLAKEFSLRSESSGASTKHPEGGDAGIEIESLVNKHSKKGRALENVDSLRALKMSTSGLGAIRESIGLLRSRIVFLRRLASSGVTGTEAMNGRADAFGQTRNSLFGETDTLPPNAPVSFPALWGFYDVTWLHYDGNTNSVLERNIAQAISLGAPYSPKSFSSTVILRNIDQLDRIARKITPPKWPGWGRPLTQENLALGKRLFDTHCSRCHYDSEPPTGEFPNDDVGTDRQRASSFAEPLKDGRTMADALASFLAKIKLQAVKSEHISDAELSEMEPKGVDVKWRITSKYFARPLHGIWASPPYLHNGSVLSVAELLKKDRLSTFRIGQNEYDPDDMGYKRLPDGAPNSKTFDTTLPGNGNEGHYYGVELGKAEKKALIDYLKTR